MSSWLDNLAAQHGEEEDEEEDGVILLQQPPAPVVQPLVIDVSNSDNISVTATPDAEENSVSFDCDDAKSEMLVTEERPPRPVFKGQASKAMEKFAKAAEKATKDEEFEYVRTVFNIRKCLNTVLQATSKPIQTIGTVGKLAHTAVSNYGTLRTKIMDLKTYMAEPENK